MSQKIIEGDLEISGALTNNGQPVGGTEWTTITTEMTSAERKQAVEGATKPYICLIEDPKSGYHFSIPYALPRSSSYGPTKFISFSQTSMNWQNEGTLKIGYKTLSDNGALIDSGNDTFYTEQSIDESFWLNGMRLPTSKAVVKFINTKISDYYTKAEVDAAIQAAIGNAIGGGY